MDTITTDSAKHLVSFASTRPSRTGQVLSDARDIETRRACEMAWFEQAGVAPEKISFAIGVTGSPTGSKAPHEMDDYIEDFNGEL